MACEVPVADDEGTLINGVPATGWTASGGVLAYDCALTMFLLGVQCKLESWRMLCRRNRRNDFESRSVPACTHFRMKRPRPDAFFVVGGTVEIVPVDLAFQNGA